MKYRMEVVVNVHDHGLLLSGYIKKQAAKDDADEQDVIREVVGDTTNGVDWARMISAALYAAEDDTPGMSIMNAFVVETTP